MFPSRYFPNRMFAKRYWPKVGADIVMGEFVKTTAHGVGTLTAVQIGRMPSVTMTTKTKTGAGRG